jgi:hypothetical protein
MIVQMQGPRAFSYGLRLPMSRLPNRMHLHDYNFSSTSSLESTIAKHLRHPEQQLLDLSNNSPHLGRSVIIPSLHLDRHQVHCRTWLSQLHLNAEIGRLISTKPHQTRFNDKRRPELIKPLHFLEGTRKFPTRTRTRRRMRQATNPWA